MLKKIKLIRLIKSYYDYNNKKINLKNNKSVNDYFNLSDIY